jgi:predicted AlkP superfamily pyrophosphatase or phosphodiesterase
MPRRLLTALCSLSLVGTAAAQAAQATRPMPSPDRVPTLVVFITVDQLRADYFDRFRDQLTGGLGRLARGGALFTNAFQDHAVTETAPGHASTMSGRFPRSTGIASNSTGVQDPQTPVLGASDPRVAPGASPFRFRGGTLIDWLRIKDPRSRALSVSRKDRSAILPLGRAHQSVYWYDPSSGRFSTSTYYDDTLPSWVQRFNARGVPASLAGREWELLLDGAGYAEPDSVPVENRGQDFTFPHTLPADPAQAVRALPDFPWMDELTLQLASTGLRELRLGTGPQTDVLAISLSTTDAVGHRYGIESRELHDQILRLDRSLGAFLDTLFALRDSGRVVIALTADHGIAPTPELSAARQHRSARRVDLLGLAQRYRAALAARGVDTSAFHFEDGMLFVDSAALERAPVNVDSVVRAFAAEARKVPGVLRADRPSELARADTVRDAIARRWYHALPPDLPVRLVVTLEPYSVWGSSVTSATGIHGSPHDYDAHVPVLLYGVPFKPGRYAQAVRVVDMAPTLAWVTATTPTDRLDGRVLWPALR